MTWRFSPAPTSTAKISPARRPSWASRRANWWTAIPPCFGGCGTSWASATPISSAPLRSSICARCGGCCCARAIPATSTRRITRAATASYDNLYVTDTTEPVDCPLCGRPAEIVSEENYFFKLSAFQDRLLKLYEDQPDFIRPAFRRNEIVRFVEAGLRDISVSRKTVKWGLPWPEDPEHVVYVWYDALTSYLSGIGYGDDEMQYEKYWPAQLHLIGKEIIRFHCVYWPAFLWAAEEQLPKDIFAHGWLLFDQQKMSKSKGNVAYAEPIARIAGRGRAALLPAARRAFWAGRQFQPRRAAHALQQRPRQRPGQSRQPHAGHDRALLRRGSDRAASARTRRGGEAPGGDDDRSGARDASSNTKSCRFRARWKSSGRRSRRWMAT